ncbi:TniQ family protein [Cognatiyoonia sp. IB215182]|uniref:TniQ family protein n=1 Tax=Cognatiyoonia sp. IB215182 TaxID=3097353 RepID=UPI002A1726C8|nr:TniQ family protein [Cognatiyoonia sp. IB215182]MDX8355573.1 TniQ family protein [Cognatiyoonia sp. IB215182]
MITTLPVARPALAGEPGFSILARNTHSNASDTTAEFCSAVGLSKAAICAGDTSELTKLAKLIKSPAETLLTHSPCHERRKFAHLNGQRLLSRSIRKADLSVCPACWEQDLSVARHQLHIRDTWLPKTISTCVKHDLALITLPYEDYTSCYDHLLRADLDLKFLHQLPDQQIQQTPSDFESAALELLATGIPICPWLGQTQMDVLEAWCFGIGLFLESGALRPENTDISSRRGLIDIGLKATLVGFEKLEAEIDAALIRHRVRLSAVWVQKWAAQSAKPPERTIFRHLMQKICSHQGRYHLASVASASAEQHYVNAQIATLAQQNKRPVVWVRKALQRERLLPPSGLPQTRDLRAHMGRCRRYINAVVDSLDSTKSATKLNIGIKGFESLVDDGVISRMRSRSHKKRRFLPSDLDRLLVLIDRNASRLAEAEPDGYFSLPEACFQLGPTTAQITRLLIGGQLPNSVRVQGSTGFAAIRINRDELRDAMRIFTDDHVGPRELYNLLGLSFGELKSLRESHLLPSFPSPPGHPRRSLKYISRIVLDRFLNECQTVRTAARHLDIHEKEVCEMIISKKIEPVPESGGVPIFHRSDLLD